MKVYQNYICNHLVIDNFYNSVKNIGYETMNKVKLSALDRLKLKLLKSKKSTSWMVG